MPTSRLPFQTDTDGATVTMDFSVSQNHAVTLADNRIFAFTKPQAGETYIVRITQDAVGSRLVTWPSSVKWAGGSAPTLTTTASRTDQIMFLYDGTYYLDIAIKKDHNLA